MSTYKKAYFLKSDSIALIVLVICFTISLLLHSRAYCLGLLASIYILFLQMYPSKRLKIALIGSILLMCGFMIAITVKFDSTLGRVLIYKISINMFKTTMPWGIGFGNFSNLYMKYQAEYFKNAHQNIKEVLLADNTYYAFNEYLQLMVEMGIAGIILVLTYITLLILLIKKYLAKGRRQTLLQTLAILYIIVISIVAIFQYPFHQYISTLVFFGALGVVVYHYFDTYKHQLTLTTLIIGVIAILCSPVGKYIYYYKSYKQYAYAKELSFAGFKSETLVNLKELYPTLKNDGQFLWFYGKQLFNAGQFDKALIILKEASTKFVFSEVYVDLADCYLANHQFKIAEKTYMEAIAMVPNRFYSRFKLYNFYTKTNQFSKAASIKVDINQLPVKVQSKQVAYIKSLIN